MKIGVLVGSLRQESFNRKVGVTLMELAPSSLDMKFIEISALSFFNQDLEQNPPKPWIEFRKEVQDLDGFILITPEYNRSIPAVLKNALDIGSRPYGQNAWEKKPCAVVSASLGAVGGFGANHHLRQALVFLDAPCMPQPEVYLSRVDTLFNEEGDLIKEETREFLNKFIQAYEAWVKVNHANK